MIISMLNNENVYDKNVTNAYNYNFNFQSSTHVADVYIL